MGEQEQGVPELATFNSCITFKAGLSAYLEGENRPDIIRHTRECASCNALLSDMEQLIAVGVRLEAQDPPARLWSNIRAALVSEGIIRTDAGFWNRWFPGFAPVHRAALAGLGCLALLSLSLVKPARFTYSGPTTVADDSKSAGSQVVVDRQLQRTVRDLQSIYQAREEAFHPAVKETYQKSLKALDASIEECADSVRREPTNSLARDYLLAAYEEKAEVLQSALEFDGR